MDERPQEDRTVPSAAEGALPPAEARPESIEELFREHHERVFRAAYRVTGSAEDAEDVLQTVFLRLARREGPIDLSPSPASYFYRSAINAALDVVRSRPRRDVGLDAVAPSAVSDPGDGPDGARGRAEVRAIVRAALAALAPKTAEMFTLRYFEGYSNQEIARLCGTTAGSVAVALHRARAQLKKALADKLFPSAPPALGEEA